MKNATTLILSALAAICIFTQPSARAEDTAAPSKDPSHMMHMKDHAGMKDMGQMKGMMSECMQMHKDGKMCNGQTMEKCEKKMGKEQCSKMMEHMKDMAPAADKTTDKK